MTECCIHKGSFSQIILTLNLVKLAWELCSNIGEETGGNVLMVQRVPKYNKVVTRQKQEEEESSMNIYNRYTTSDVSIVITCPVSLLNVCVNSEDYLKLQKNALAAARYCLQH